MDNLTFDDYKNRISIQEVLQDAGYHFYRRDGLRYPSYVRLDNEGRRIRGDKFIVCANGMACFQPPEIKKYNVINFIAEHPHFFPEGNAGKDPYAVVNEVCHRLLNVPMEERKQRIYEPRKDIKPFAMTDYRCESWINKNWDSQTKFFPYFKPRGITRQTQQAFADHFYLATPLNKQGARTNLSFPMRIPGNAKIVGLEQRGMPDRNGKSSYKGMARGTNATEGVWMASPKLGLNTLLKLGRHEPMFPFEGEMMKEVKDVYWFESAFDAMAYYQVKMGIAKQNYELYKKQAENLVPDSQKALDYLKAQIDRLDNALYVSTGGSPSIHQLKGVLAKTPTADQHVCFDNDRAGHVFAVDLLMTRAGRNFQTSVLENGQLQVIDQTEKKGKKYTLNLEPFEFDRIAHVLGVGNPDMKDYIQSISYRHDFKSGDYDLLPSHTLVASLYDKIYALSEQRNSGELLYGIPPEQEHEVLHRYDMVIAELHQRFADTLKADVEAYKRNKSSIDIELPPTGYKDWNEVTMDKRQYDEQDTISTVGENGEVITDEVNQDHEENVKRDEDNDETTKRHFRR